MNKNEFVLKINEMYYSKLMQENKTNKFKNMIFKELQDSHRNYTRNNVSSNVGDEKTQSNYRYLTSTREEMRIYLGDYLSKKRNIKFYISRSQECSVFINDSVVYEKLSNINFIEHMVLHNNGESVEPKGVYSNQVNINFFAFNRKLNIFSVYFENPKDYPSFTIEFEYYAKNLLKSVIEPEKRRKRRMLFNSMKRNLVKENYLQTNKSFNHNASNSSQVIVKRHETRNTNYNTIDSFNPNIHHYNWFIWKLLNQNFMKTIEKVKIEIFFNLGKEFESTDVHFSVNFTKTIEEANKERNVKYVWEGDIQPQQIMILDVKFPMYFETCGNLNLSWIMIIIGSVFIIFLISMLHLILSTIFFEDF